MLELFCLLLLVLTGLFLSQIVANTGDPLQQGDLFLVGIDGDRYLKEAL